ncbi:unnamed protein product [Mucor hiemalis]
MRGVCLIQIVGYQLELPVHTVATAAALYHRFFTRRSFYDYKYTRIAQACLFIACKSDESSRRSIDIAKSWTYKPNETRNEKAIAKFVSDLLHNELIVLEVTCFDMSFEHPYYDMLEFAKEIKTPNDITTAALAFINDSYRLPLNLWYEPKAIAATALIMGYHTNGVSCFNDANTSWTAYIDENAELIGEIAGSIMEVYKFPKYTEKKNH